MRELLKWATRFAGRGAPAALAVGVALSIGVYSGHAAVLTAHRSARHTFTLAVPRRALTLQIGSSMSLPIKVHRRHLRARITFKLVSKLPSGLSVRFMPPRTRGRRTILTLRASAAAAPRRYRLRIRASGGHVHRVITLTLDLVVPRAGVQTRSGPVPDFSLTGNAGGPLEPGLPEPIDVLITNPNSAPLTLTSLAVTVQAISAPQASPGLPCTQPDFVVQPYSGQVPLTVAAGASVSLSGLGVPVGQWPQISLADLPTNQDGCQGASLTLAYSADARLG